MATLADIINSGADTNTLDPQVRALVSNVKPASRAVWDLHKDGETIVTVVYDTYTRPARARAGVIGAGWADGVDTTALAVPASSIALLDVGYTMKIEDELVIVKSVDRTGNTIDVYARGAGGTTGVAHATSTPFLVHTVAVPEGTNPGSGLFDETVKSSNGIQLINRQIKATYTEAKQRRKTIDDLLALREQEEMTRVIEDLNNASINGYYDAGNADGSQPRMTRGLIQSIIVGGNSNLVTSTAGAFTEARVEATLQAIWEAKGTVDTIILSTKNKQLANKFGSFQARIADTRGNMLGQISDGIVADGIGDVFFTVDHDMPNDTVIYANSEDMEKAYFVEDQLRIVNTSDPENPRVVKKTIMAQFGFNYKNLQSNFGLDMGLTT